MALFNKKLSLEEILKAIANLSEEEKAELKANLEDKPEEEPSETEQTEEKGEVATEQPVEETEEVAEGDTELEENNDFEDSERAEEPEQNVETTPETDQMNAVEEENQEDVIGGVMERLQALEEKFAQFEELKALMENYTKKQADSFGYKGAVPGARKDMHDMSASELKQKMLNGEI